ncbi:C1 family peptidase [Pigmentibacter ruber]|nr:C1 family peptidase [Pigmentibacter ruber]
MKWQQKVFLYASLFSLISFQSFAAENSMFQLEGTKETTIIVKSKTSSTARIEKKIRLMKMTASNAMKLRNKKVMDNYFELYEEKDYSQGISSFSESSNAKDLGMSLVPVLDQGNYGTCVTFSSTAALDAKLANLYPDIQNYSPDFIDQQCILSLNKYLGNNFWNGADNPGQILEPLKTYGIVEKNNCNGVFYSTPSFAISSANYSKISKKEYTNHINYNYLQKADLNSLKEAIDKGNRVLIGFALANYPGNKISVNGFDLNINFTSTSGGLWACKQPESEINYCPSDAKDGHEVIVIGYDDTQQLLKIRNSWSEGAGDNGDFYMTYTFFEAMAKDQTELY